MKLMSMTIMANLQMSLRKFFHGEVIATVSLALVSRCQAAKQPTTYPDYVLTIFPFVKYRVDRSTQHSLQVSFLSISNMFSLIALLHDGRQFIRSTWRQRALLGAKIQSCARRWTFEFQTGSNYMRCFPYCCQNKDR